VWSFGLHTLVDSCTVCTALTEEHPASAAGYATDGIEHSCTCKYLDVTVPAEAFTSCQRCTGVPQREWM